MKKGLATRITRGVLMIACLGLYAGVFYWVWWLAKMISVR